MFMGSPSNPGVVLVGDRRSGKTTLINRFCYARCDYRYISTPFFLTHSVSHNGHTLDVSEVPGKCNVEQCRGLESWFTRAKTILICVDIHADDYNAQIAKWSCLLKSNSVKCIVVGTKTDDTTKKSFSSEIAASAATKGMKYIECSAKTGVGVEEVFVTAGVTQKIEATDRDPLLVREEKPSGCCCGCM